MPRIDNPLLYPDSFKRYVTESGRVRTAATEEAVMIHLRGLQRLRPGIGIRGFRDRDLTAYCLSNDAAPRTQVTRRSILQSVFEWFTFMGIVKDNPAIHLRFTVHPKNATVRSHTWLSAADFRKLLTELPSETLVDRRDRMIVYVAALTGLRSSNLSTLRWSMFEPGLRSVRVVTKGQKLAEFGMPDLLVSELTAWRHELAPHQRQELVHDGPLFPSFQPQMTADASGYELVCRWNVALGKGGVGIAVNKAGERVFPGKPRLCPHDLRRSYASYLEAEGFDIKDISRALGHENMSTTSVYLDRNPDKAVAVGRSIRITLA